MQDFKNLKIWEKGHELTLEVYKVIKSFPKEELFILTSQMKRAVTSIPTNIAEGCGKASKKDFARFLNIAFGSASELEYQLLLARDLNYLSETDYLNLLSSLVSLKKQIYAFIQKLSQETE